MNIGYEDDELKPFVEPLPDINDPVRIGNVQHLYLFGLISHDVLSFSSLFFGLTCIRSCMSTVFAEREDHACCMPCTEHI